jgi:hypothetical protein
MKQIRIGDMIELKCSLGYTQNMHTLILVMDSDVTISMVKVE